jgi:hypothetical protein
VESDRRSTRDIGNVLDGNNDVKSEQAKIDISEMSCNLEG